jgi:nucleoid DNA-binding protein
MLPKKSKHFIKPTADKLNCNVQLVDDVINFFYSEVRKSLIGMEGPIVNITNLGSFTAMRKTLPRLVAKYQKHLEVLEPETFSQMKTKKAVEAKLNKVLALQKAFDEEWKRKQQFLKDKNESGK